MIIKPQIIADINIPFLQGKLDHLFAVKYLAADEINSEVVRNASGLIIRSVTKINKELLEGSMVKFVTTATIGDDHIDKNYCRENNIKYYTAKGCNANAVSQYVLTALLVVNQKKDFLFKNKTIGIIGVGNIGSKVAEISKNLGMRVLLNDPPRVRIEGSAGFCGLDEIMKKADIITFHVPMIKFGVDKTFHLADNSFFHKLKNKVLFINTSRGEVVETGALLDAINNKIVKEAIIDVWEGEPEINRELLDKAYITTPHIAGYSLQGKFNATKMCLKALSDFFSVDISKGNTNKLFSDALEPLSINQEYVNDIRALAGAVAKTYNIFKDSTKLKNNPEQFTEFRNHYSYRNEFTFKLV